MLVTVSLILLLLTAQSQNVLTTVRFQDTVITGKPIPSNFAGVSINFNNIYTNALNSTLFAQYIKNSWVFGSTTASWGISLKVQYPAGTKWNCPSWKTILPAPLCTLDIKIYYAKISTFFKLAANNYVGVSLGFDRQGANLANATFQNIFFSWYFDFLNTIGYIGGGNPSIEMFDQADTYQTRSMTPQTYNVAAFQAEVLALQSLIPGTVLGPGLSTSANSSWKDTYNTLPSTYQFSVYATPFKLQS